MKKMADKDEMEFLKYMKEKGGFESSLTPSKAEIAEDMMREVDIPEMSDFKARKAMKQAGEAVYDNPKMNALKKIAGKGSKAASIALAPILGLGAALSSGDASAAIPVLNSAESVGMSPEQEDQMLAEIKGKMDYQQSPAARDRAEALAKLAKLKK